jgi:hypothetical protein
MFGETELLLGLAFLLLKGGKKAGGSATSSADAWADGDALLARAAQQPARDFIPLWVQLGEAQAVAEAYARWAGIESSGNPLAVSTLGERGLFQVGRPAFDAIVKTGALRPDDWDKMINPLTTREEHARIANMTANALEALALKHVINPPVGLMDRIWYAKLYHQRPVAVRDAHPHGDALPMARDLKARWANDKTNSHYLRAANVVAFGSPEVDAQGDPPIAQK